MKRTAWLWIIALLVTVASARWQRVTGPTHEFSGTATIGGTAVRYVLDRTHPGPGDHRVVFKTLPADVTGAVEWKDYRSQDPWTVVAMRREGGALVGELPHRPPAGKLWYRVRLARGGESVLLPPDRPVAIRYRGDVPAGVLVPHILLMFLAMLLSTRAGLEVFAARPRFLGLTLATLGALFLGGIVIGVFVTHYAFGEWWTGFPVGDDITDSKTLAAFVAWLVAAFALRSAKLAKGLVALAALVMLVVFAVPHSWTAREPLHAALDAAGTRTAAPVEGAAATDTAVAP
jgi:hypothetical protein